MTETIRNAIHLFVFAFFGVPSMSKTAIFGILRQPKKGTFGEQNFSIQLILRLVGKNEKMAGVSY